MSESKGLTPLMIGGLVVGVILAVVLGVVLLPGSTPSQTQQPDAVIPQEIVTRVQKATPEPDGVAVPSSLVRKAQPKVKPPGAPEDDLSAEEREAWKQAERAGTDIVYEDEAPAKSAQPRSESSGPDVLNVGRSNKTYEIQRIPALKKQIRALGTGGFMNSNALQRAKLNPTATVPYILPKYKKLEINRNLPTTVPDSPPVNFDAKEHISENYPGE